MMLYSIVPPEVIWSPPPDGAGPVEDVALGPGMARALCAIAPDGTRTLQRLVSVNPRDYLRPQWQPGAVAPPAHAAPPRQP